MRQSKPMARMVADKLVEWLDDHPAEVGAIPQGDTKAWRKILYRGLHTIRPKSFAQAFAQAVKMLPAPWTYERRRGKNGWIYRFWREEPATVIPTPAGPEIQEEPVRMTPEEFCRRKCEIEYTPYEKCRVNPCCSYREYFSQEPQPANQPSATTVTDAFEVVSKQNEALTEENARLRAQLAERPACPADFIHKGAVRKRLIDMLLDPGAALDITLLNYVRELED